MNIRFLIVLIIVVSITFQSCKEILSEGPVVTFHNNNVLLPEIKFRSTDSTKVVIEYWPANEKSKIRQSTQSVGSEHDIILVNITPVTKYNYVIKDLNTSETSDVHEFTTAEVPKGIVQVRKDKIDSTLFDGYILIRRFYKAGADVIINNKGDIVWYNAYDTAVRRAFFWTGHSILSTYDTSRIVEYNMTGDKILDIDLTNSDHGTNVHHEILYDKTGNIITISTDSLSAGKHQFQSLKGKPVYGDGILRLKPDGSFDWKWSVLSEKKFKVPKEVEPKGKEPLGHANSIEIDTDGNYLISMRDFSQVWKINSQTGAVMWKLGKGGDFKMPEESYFIKQHSVHINPSGHILMFDNGEHQIRPNSRIVSLKLNEKEMTAEPQAIIELPRALTSYRMCSVYTISEDKYLVCTSRKNVVLSVVNGKGEILWKASGDNSSYRAYYIQNPFEQN